MEPLVLLGRELRGVRRTTWRVALVPGPVVRPEEHGFPELTGLTLTERSVPNPHFFPMTVTLAQGSPVRHAGIDVFRVGVRQFQVFTFRAMAGRPSRPLSAAAFAAVAAVRASDSTSKRLVLADVLEEEGALAEADFLRKELELATVYDVRGPAVLAQLKDYVAITAAVGPTFRYLVGRDVDGCTGPRWTFRCPRRRDDLLPTDDPALGFCERCVNPVALVKTQPEATALENDGVCVSLDRPRR